MPRGDKSAYTDKQKRRARHIEEGYKRQGVPEDEAERRAWATVNKVSGGGKKSGSGRGKKTDKSPMKRGGKKGGSTRSTSTRRKSATRKTIRRSTSSARSRAKR